MTKKFNFSTFAEWFLNVTDETVKSYKGDILIDAKKIVELRNECLFNPQRDEPQSFSLYWGVRETGTWIYHNEGNNRFTLNDLMSGLGAKRVFLITFQYDTAKNETITVREVVTSNIIKIK